MIGRRHGNLIVVEDLVDMCVEGDVVGARPSVHETVPIRVRDLEGVVDCDDCVWIVLADSAPAVVVVLLDGVHVEIWAEWLIDKFDHGDCRVAGIALGQRIYGGDGIGSARVSGLPVYRPKVAGVVKAILGASRY